MKRRDARFVAIFAVLAAWAFFAWMMAHEPGDSRWPNAIVAGMAVWFVAASCYTYGRHNLGCALKQSGTRHCAEIDDELKESR